MKKILSLVLCLLFLLPGVLCFAEPSYDSVESQKVVERAFQECGKPYQWGAVGPDGYDASGLVSYCLTGVHRRLGTTTNFLDYPRVDDPQPGDICVSMEHCGIYIGADKMIHAPAPGYVVQISSVQSGMIFTRYEGWDSYTDSGEKSDGAAGKDIYLNSDGIKGDAEAPDHKQWIEQSGGRLEELEQEEREKEKEPINESVDSTDSNLSPATGIIGASVALPLAFTCIGLAMIGLSVLCIRRRK